jgi:predicted transposase YdaD
MPPSFDHDALFKLLLTAFFREFLALFAPELATELSAEPLIFLDKESFSELLDPDRREADLVVQARLHDQPTTLLIHLEHQAQADVQLDRRMFRYFARFYDRYDTPIYPIALCSYPRPRRAVPDRHQLLLPGSTVLDFHFRVIQLNRLDWRAFLQTTNPVAVALMARMQIAATERWRVKAAALRLLAGIELTGAQRRLIAQFVDLYLPLKGAEEQAFRMEAATFSTQEKEIVMEFETSWERKGRVKGRAEGRAEGQRLLIEQLLAHKFGPLPAEQTAQLARLRPAQLKALGVALLEFTQPAQLRAWLEAHPAPPPSDPEAS